MIYLIGLSEEIHHPNLINNKCYFKHYRCIAPFNPTTLVRTADGLRPISEVRIGDMVLAWDETTRTTGLFTVTDLLVHIDPAQVHLSVGGEFIETTPKYPFYTLERGWVDAGDLWIGAHIRRANGTFAPVLFIDVETEAQVFQHALVVISTRT